MLTVGVNIIALAWNNYLNLFPLQMYLLEKDNAQQAMLSKYHHVIAKAIQVVYIKGRQQKNASTRKHLHNTMCLLTKFEKNVIKGMNRVVQT